MQTVSTDDGSFLTEFVSMALRGLATLYDEQQKLFTYRIQQGHLTMMPLTWSIAYTAMTLIGLIKASQHDWNEFFFIDEAETLQALVRELDRVGRLGDLGLILWADAYCEGNHWQAVLGAVKQWLNEGMLERTTTMELAWLLTGLSYTYQRSGHDGDVEKLAMVLHEAISNNFNRNTGLFRHRYTGNWPGGIRDQISNFADQIYAIYALSTFYEVFDRPESLQLGLQCAHRLCELQGGQGQWWWHYNARRGGIASRYPVFAVHQDGMAPMALFKLSDVSGQDFHQAIHRGLSWLFGANELGLRIVDWDQSVVWRSIERTLPAAYLRYFSIALTEVGWAGAARLFDSVPTFKLNYEMRPYHLGWVLYAFADRHSFHPRLSDDLR